MVGFAPISGLLVADRAAELPVAHSPRGLERWEQFRRDVGALACRLKAAGGHDWLLASDDAHALAVALLAVFQVGGRALLPSNLQPGHICELARSADGVLVHPQDLVAAEQSLTIFEQKAPAKAWQFCALDPDRCQLQLHTSGTTGRPEPVRKPLRCLEAEVAVLESAFRPTAAQSILATVPAYHIYGLLFRVLWPLSAGRTLEAAAIAFPEELVALAEQRPAPLLVSSPAFLKRALPFLDLAYLGQRLCAVFSSGGPLAPDVAAAYNAALTCRVVEVYGSTETGGIAHRVVVDGNAPPAWTPLPGVGVEIAGDDGLVTVHSSFVAAPQPFVTGDRGRVAADGGFYLEGRRDRIVKLEERRISLLEIEERLKGAPEVDDVRVLVLESDAARTAIAAVVVPAPGGWEILARGGKRALRRRLHERLKPHLEALALPRRWRFVRRLPESAQGKTTAAVLVALFAPAGGNRVDPVAIRRAVGKTAEIVMDLPRELAYFDGHFDAAAILPGVVQVDWAVRQARQCFPMPGLFQRIEALKFFRVLPAGTRVTLNLSFDPIKGRLEFSYRAGAVTHSSGRVRFGAAP